MASVIVARRGLLTIFAVVISCLCLTAEVAEAINEGMGGTNTPSPPVLLHQAVPELAYKVGGVVRLPCEAYGLPQPRYEWTKNGHRLNTNAVSGITQFTENGTIEIAMGELRSQHDGVYQCRATNEFGTAVSIKTVLKKATLDPFPTVKDPRVHYPQVGSSLTLRCSPPASYPKGTIYWGETKSGLKVRPIENTDRISLDYDGGLHFSNIEEADGRKGSHYVCVVLNLVLRNYVEGDDQRIEPIRPTAPRYEAPRLMWSSPLQDVAVRGQMKKMKCIFSGYPTPRVTWSRVDTAMPAKNNISSSFGQELLIPDADFTDGGRYQCSAMNTESGNSVIKEFNLVVESTPFWRNGRGPENVVTSEDEDATFECNVNGFPRPVISWLVNGQPVEAVPNPRRAVEAGGARLVFRGVVKDETQVVQCNASNSHGYIFANAYLNVLAEKPVFLEEPRDVLKAARGRTATLTCRVFGAPKPTITWQKGPEVEDVEAYGDSRITKLENGDLEIQNVNYNDNDTYTCYVYNKFGSDLRSGRLLVIESTQILDPPQPRQVYAAGSNVTLWCNATTDPSELHKLHIEWRRGDRLLLTGSGSPVGRRTVERNGDDQSDNENEDDDDGSALRFEIGDGGRRLTISDAHVSDSGSYTCKAMNGIDEDSATVQIVVRDRPSPPVDVRLSECRGTFADVSWTPGPDNNDRITGYVVYQSTSRDVEQSSSSSSGSGSSTAFGQLQLAARVDAGKLSVRIRDLAAWNEYTFYVAAVNSVGESEPARVMQGTGFSSSGSGASVGSSSKVCVTPEAKPARSPKKVCTVSRQADELVIVWEPMLRSEHHGNGFHYVVSYRRRDIPNVQSSVEIVSDWRQSELKISRQPTFTEYDVSVQAKNNIGAAEPTKVIGYSGEDDPLEVVKNFSLDDDSVNATSAAFTWDAVDTSVSRIRGFFTGYQIKFWRKSDPDTVRIEDIPLRKWRPCRSAERTARSPAAFDGPADASEATERRTGADWERSERMSATVHRVTNKLWPYSIIEAGVVVLNGARSSSISNIVQIETPEGVPGAVRQFQIVEKGSHHFNLTWLPPVDINGVHTGYDIIIKEVSDPGTVWETIVIGAEHTVKKIYKLTPETDYVITIHATTSKGRGEAVSALATTAEASPPDQPKIDSVTVGHDFISISWQPSEKNVVNPASDYDVEYRLEGSDKWEVVKAEDDRRFINLTGLLHDHKYEVRVVGRNPNSDEGVPSRTERIVVGYRPPAAVTQSVASSSWFIALLCLFALLLLVLLVVVLFRYNRGGMYPVYKKEQKHGTSGGHFDEENQFCEFVRSEDPMKKKSQGSLESSSRSEDEDGSDSLGVYEDGCDPAKFNDDGSFVDQSAAATGYKKLIDQMSANSGLARSAQNNPAMIITSSPSSPPPHSFV